MLILYIALGVLVLLIILILIAGIKIVSQTNVYIVERLGTYRKTLSNGVHFIIPLFERIVLKESIKEKVLDFPAQDVITKDNVTMKIDTVVYLQIIDPKLYAYGVEKPLFAVENLTATTLRNLIGDLELDQSLTSRDSINEKLRVLLDDATDAWGIKILRVELKNILPPQDIRQAMEKQMRAEREKRESILVAEGFKQSEILKAEGSKQAKILSAQAEKESKILESEAKKQSLILEAEGKQQAIELINKAKPTEASLLLQSFETLSNVSKSNSSTLIVPSDVSNLASMSSVIAKALKADKKGGEK